MQNPFSQIRDPINHDIYERFIKVFDPHILATQIYEDVSNKIQCNIRELTPELLINFNDLYKEISLMFGSITKTLENIEKKSKKLFESSSLTQDVYNMRDEMKVIKKKLDKLNNGLKGFAKLQESLKD